MASSTPRTVPFSDAWRNLEQTTRLVLHHCDIVCPTHGPALDHLRILFLDRSTGQWVSAEHVEAPTPEAFGARYSVALLACGCIEVETQMVELVRVALTGGARGRKPVPSA